MFGYFKFGHNEYFTIRDPARHLKVERAPGVLRLGLLNKSPEYRDRVSAICLLLGEGRKGDYICQFLRRDLTALVRLNMDRASIIGCAGLATEWE